MSLLRFLVLFGFSQTAFAQGLWMYPNQGQWDERILYNMPLSAGRLYVEQEGLTFFLSNATFHAHDHDKTVEHHEEAPVYHALQQRFVHAQKATFTSSDSSQHYHNYFLGNDQSKWKSKIHGVKKLNAAHYFPNGSLHYLTHEQQFAFHLQLQAFADIHELDFEINGADSLFIDERGILHLTHRFGEITYSAPKAWNLISETEKKEVQVVFALNNNVVSFQIVISDSFLYSNPLLFYSTNFPSQIS